jgi:methylated-DNA-[protein]-cysteine S-methyltransferase
MTTTNEHTILTTALGDLTVVRNGGSMVGLYFPHHWYRPAQDTFGPRTDAGFDEVERQLTEYLSGVRREFDLPLEPRGTDQQRRVWDLIADVPHGRTTTYGAIAGRLDAELTPQEVGVIVGRNPLSILVPCHRVVSATGKLTGYAGGLRRKQRLLELEGIELVAGRVAVPAR